MPEALTLHRCTACGALDPISPKLCRACGGAAFEAVDAAGTGELVSWTVVRRPPLRFAGRPPYGIAVVALSEGIQVTGRLEAFDPPPAPGAAMRVVRMEEGVPVFG